MSFNKTQSYFLSELYTISSGLSKSREEFGFGYPFVTFKDVFDNYFLPDKLSNLANTSEKERERCSVKKGDVFLTRTSETQEELGMSCVALRDYENATFNGFTKRLRLKPKFEGKIDPIYMAYYMRSSVVRNQINSLSIMTTRASLNNSMIERLKVEIPQIEEQITIGRYLKLFDEKVKANNEIKVILENIVKAIFTHWFIEYEFPNDNGEPYKSSGGEMVESKIGLIPKGWNVDNILDNIQEVKIKNKENSEIPVLSVVKEGTFVLSEDYFTKQVYSKNTKNYKIISRNCLGYNPSRANIGSIAVLREFERGLLSPIYKIFEFNGSISPIYFLMYMKKQVFKDFIVKHSSGTTRQNFDYRGFSEFFVAVPDKKLQERFTNLFEKIEKFIRYIDAESEKLVKMRDLILSKLISGEITIPSEEKQFIGKEEQI
jgi:type I restriction enzyme S subunit